jgi:hypothetical protein
VVGGSANNAFLWTPNFPNSPNGTLTLLGENIYEAVAINSHGQIVGCDTSCTDASSNLPKLWSPTVPNGTTGSWIDFTSLPDNGFNAAVRGINSIGQVVGFRRIGNSRQAFLWTPTVPNGTSGSVTYLADLPESPESNSGIGINDFGQVTGIGNANTVSGANAIVWTPTNPNGTTGSVQAVAELNSESFGINNYGQVVGRTLSKGAFVWTPDSPNGTTGSVTYIGSFPGIESLNEALAVNSKGEVVGSQYLAGLDHAFLWRPTTPNGSIGSILDLNTLLSPEDAAHWVLQKAQGINDSGQIVGWGAHDPNGSVDFTDPIRAFLLTPVPEPDIGLLVYLVALAWTITGLRLNRF